MVKSFTDTGGRTADQIQLDRCAVAYTFGAFADEIGPEGFQFLYQRLKAGHEDGPILVAVENERIVGAIGPLSSHDGTKRADTSIPAYFAVHPDHRGRGRGHGPRRLWRASMGWGRDHGAEIKILQASTGSAAEALHAPEGAPALR